MVCSISTESASSGGFTMSEETDTSTIIDSDDIPSFFRHTTIFITGVTGFLGHVLLSKLLSSCPDIRKIYILLREKKNQDVNERFQELFDAPIFEKLKHDNPKVFLKMAAIKGDCLRPNLGISETDRLILQNEVNIVFHVAATVRFDAPLRDAVNINVRSTRDLLEVAKKMKHLKSFVHISTAFSYCADRNFIEEKLYEPPMSASSLITLVDQLSDKVVDKITPVLIGSFPNTYVFTKAVAEGLFTSKSLDLPTSIFRPAIVISTAKEPIPGWINNLYGPTGIVAAAGIGLVHTVYTNKDCKANIVPCDYVINGLLAVAWYTAKHWKPLKMNSEKLDDLDVRPVPVFNYSSSATKNSLTWNQFMEGNAVGEPEMPFSHSIWKYSLTLNKNKFFHNILTIFLHILPALIVDNVATICGKEPKLMKSYEKIHKMTNVLSYFSVREWVISIDNMQNLWNTLSEKDKKMFDFDLNALDWMKYFKSHLFGIRLYILKDSSNTIPYAIKKRRRLIITHYAVLSLIILLFSYFFYVLSRVFF